MVRSARHGMVCIPRGMGPSHFFPACVPPPAFRAAARGRAVSRHRIRSSSFHTAPHTPPPRRGRVTLPYRFATRIRRHLLPCKSSLMPLLWYVLMAQHSNLCVHYLPAYTLAALYNHGRGCRFTYQHRFTCWTDSCVVIFFIGSSLRDILSSRCMGYNPSVHDRLGGKDGMGHHKLKAAHGSSCRLLLYLFHHRPQFHASCGGSARGTRVLPLPARAYSLSSFRLLFLPGINEHVILISTLSRIYVMSTSRFSSPLLCAPIITCHKAFSFLTALGRAFRRCTLSPRALPIHVDLLFSWDADSASLPVDAPVRLNVAVWRRLQHTGGDG